MAANDLSSRSSALSGGPLLQGQTDSATDDAGANPTTSDKVTATTEQERPAYAPLSVEDAVSKLWEHLGMGRSFVVDEEQPGK